MDKERGVVIEEWRGGLGAGTRIRDKQIPVLYYHSRYADRLPIGKPDIIRTAPAARLREFYDTWYRPERMAVIAVGDVDPQEIEHGIRDAFGPLKTARAAGRRRTARCRSTADVVSVIADPEVTQSSVQIVRKRPKERDQPRRRLPPSARRERSSSRCSTSASASWPGKPDAKFLAPAAGRQSLSPRSRHSR